MKTTIDIPDDALRDAMRFTNAKTKKEAVLAALEDFNRRNRMAVLARHLGTFDSLMTNEEMERLDAARARSTRSAGRSVNLSLCSPITP